MIAQWEHYTLQLLRLVEHVPSTTSVSTTQSRYVQKVHSMIVQKPGVWNVRMITLEFTAVPQWI